jgi:cytochrome c oxidase assembly protein Cox11
MSSLTPEVFDTLIIVVIILGLALAAVRLYADFTRRIDDGMTRTETDGNDDDTRPNSTAKNVGNQPR